MISPGGGKEEKPVPPTPSTPLKPVQPIHIPKDTPNDDRLKQLESPETVELIKTFEITDPVTPPSEPEPAPKPVPKEPTPPPPVVAGKPQPIVTPNKVPTADPTDAMFSPPKPQQQQDKREKKDIKEATSDFLAQEFGEPKKTSKRYTKSRQKKNHS